MLDQQKEAFREEAGELLSDLEKALLELEDSPDDPELVGKVFRALHTIKGSGAMFGFDAVSAFTHEVETVYDRIRCGDLAVTHELVTLSLAARDHIQALLEAPETVQEEQTRELIAAFRQWSPAPQTAPAASASVEGLPPAGEQTVIYRIRFRPARDIFLRGANPVALLNELRDLGRCRVVAQTDALPSLGEIDPEGCYTYWDIILATDRGLEAIRDVFIFVEDDSELKIDIVDDGSSVQDEEVKRIGEILIERGDLTPEALAGAMANRKRLGEFLVDCHIVSPEKIAAALAEQQLLREVRREREGAGASESLSSIRVAADKLDALVDLVGELVTIQSRLAQTAAGRDDTELTLIAEEVERLTAELRDQTLKIRMLPIGTSFSRFKRLVRDLSQELGKEIEMQTSGAETELDKTVIEKLGDPLVHIIRNSIDHGIELPEVREKAGKPRQGTIHLSAEHSGDSVIIEISDDGAGLDRDAIRRKGIERGVITEQETLSDKEIFQLIFAPGFSTARKVTSVSGRGVGMDVVKRAIDALRGTVEISSRRGEGTTLRIRLPLTLAIIESLLVRVGEAPYVIPLAQVEECIELTREDVQKAHGRHLVRVRDHLIPYIPLRERFGIDGDPPEIQQVVITRCNGLQVGFVVDHVIGEHQTVIKTLGRMYRHVQELSGATILGDGRVALILDVAQLIRGVEFDEKMAV